MLMERSRVPAPGKSQKEAAAGHSLLQVNACRGVRGPVESWGLCAAGGRHAGGRWQVAGGRPGAGGPVVVRAEAAVPGAEWGGGLGRAGGGCPRLALEPPQCHLHPYLVSGLKSGLMPPPSQA